MHINVQTCPCIECRYWRGESDKAIEVVTCVCPDAYIDDGWFDCVDGMVYGPCESEYCQGSCEAHHECVCGCHKR